MSSMASSVITCYVKLQSGKALSMEVLPSEKVSSIYEHVANDMGIPAETVILKYTGKVVDKNKTVGYLGIREETILKAEVIERAMYTVYVKLPSKKTVEVQIANTDRVQNVRDIVESKEGPPSAGQKYSMKYSGVAVKDEHVRLYELGMTNEAVIELEEQSCTLKETRSSTNDVKAEDLDTAEKERIVNSFKSDGKRVEVVFSFDTTGSMYSCLQQVRTNIRETCSRLMRDIADIRIGILAHGDYCDFSTYVVRSLDLTANVQALVDFVENVPSTGGGDAPEAYEWMLHKAQQLDWAEDSAKALVVIGDSLPHHASYTTEAVNWRQELDVLKAMGVKVYGVKALGQNNEDFYREIAETTGGCYITLANFSIITEMFLAVCYQEAAAEQFEAFCEEVEEQGKMTSEVKQMLDQVKAPATRQTTPNPIDWWVQQADVQSRPLYKYVLESDSWAPFTGPSLAPINEHPAGTSSYSTGTDSVKTASSKQKSFKNLLGRLLKKK